jgi:predicted ATPase/DNA-binding SARP family transcriptional activator
LKRLLAHPRRRGELLVKTSTHETHPSLNRPWTVCLVGGLHVRGLDCVFDRFPTKRSALILARLAFARGQAVHRNELCKLLWPDDLLGPTRTLLRNELTRLRKALGEAADIIAVDKELVWLRPELVTSEVEQFFDFLEEARKAPTASAKQTALRDASELHIEKVLPEFDEPWIEEEKRKLRAQSVSTWLVLGAALASSGDVSGARHALTEALELDPDNEFAKRAIPNLEAPVQRPGAIKSNIPKPLTSLLGRDSEVASIKAFLQPDSSSAARLVSIKGPGGIGKTHLSLEAAQVVKPLFASQVWFVSLLETRDPRAVAQEILTQLDIDHAADANPFKVLVNVLPKQPCLLILDNFEQLVDGGAEVVERLLRQNEQLSILVTTRQRLGLLGEQEVSLEPLPQHPDGPAVELFIRTARSINPTSPDDPESREAIEAIVKRLEGFPLAIILAASNSRILTPVELSTRIANDSMTLRSRIQSSDRRHRTLEDTIEWSFDSLTNELSQTFLDLSIFNGGATLDAITKILGVEDAQSLTDELCGRSLLNAYPDGEGMRFRMLETLREFSRHHQDPDRGAWVRGRHTAYFLEFAEEGCRKLRGPDQKIWLRRFESEHDNLRSALVWNAEHDIGGARELCAWMWRFWIMRGYHIEGRRWLELVLSHPYPSNFTTAWALFGAGGICHEQGDPQSAKNWFEESARVYGELGLGEDQLFALLNLSTIHRAEANYEVTVKLSGDCVREFLEAGNERGASHAMEDLAIAQVALGQTAEAISTAEKMVAYRRAEGDLVTLGSALIELGSVLYQSERLAEARVSLNEGLTLSREFGHNTRLARALSILANIDILEGNYELAKEQLDHSETIAGEYGDQRSPAESALARAYLHLALGYPALALEHAKTGLAISRAGSRTLSQIQSIETVARVSVAIGNISAAAVLLAACDHLRKGTNALRLPSENRFLEPIRVAVADQSPALADRCRTEGENLNLDQASELATESGVARPARVQTSLEF